jgi:hypothetical protein
MSTTDLMKTTYENYLNTCFTLNRSVKLKGSTLIGPNMLKVEEGKFSRVFIEVHLIHPDVRKIWLNDYWCKVQYEDLHMICTCMVVTATLIGIVKEKKSSISHTVKNNCTYACWMLTIIT